MARELISLVPDKERYELTLEARVLSGEITAENFNELPEEEQKYVNSILFKMASDQIEPNQGTSAIEFILFAFMRITNKKVNGIGLTAEDREIEEGLNRILQSHQITNSQTFKKDWLFDYMQYAEVKSTEFLKNRLEHIERKKQVTGKA